MKFKTKSWLKAGQKGKAPKEKKNSVVPQNLTSSSLAHVVSLHQVWHESADTFCAD